MWLGVEMLETNVGMGLEHIVLLILIMGGLIFAAKDIKLTFIEWLATSGVCFIWFYERGLDYTIPLVWFFISIILLAFSLFAVNKASKTGGLG